MECRHKSVAFEMALQQELQKYSHKTILDLPNTTHQYNRKHPHMLHHLSRTQKSRRRTPG